MELAQILRELGRHKVWLGVAVLVAIVAGILQAYPPTTDPIGLKKRTLEIGAASTDVVIDSKTSTIIDLSGDVEPLAQRAQTYTRLAGSTPVLKLIARRVGVPEGSIQTGSTGGEVSSEERANQLAGENAGYRLAFNFVESQPLIGISAEAPSAEAAAGLANGAAAGLQQYVIRQQDQQRVPPRRRVTLRQIGTAEGSVINSGVNVVAAVLTGLAAFLGFCLLILFVTRTRADLQRARASDETPVWTDDSSEATDSHPLHNGHGAASAWEPFEPGGRPATPVSEEDDRVADRR
jgi:hypothetical protein